MRRLTFRSISVITPPPARYTMLKKIWPDNRIVCPTLFVGGGGNDLVVSTILHEIVGMDKFWERMWPDPSTITYDTKPNLLSPTTTLSSLHTQYSMVPFVDAPHGRILIKAHLQNPSTIFN
jgi:hypothetical protein